MQVVDINGIPNGPFMHDGSKATLLDVVNHYNSIPNIAQNTNLNNRLRRAGNQTQQLNLTNAEKGALVAFLETLSGTDVYTNDIWSDPFEPDGTITIINGTVSTQEEIFGQTVNIYPNPVEENGSIDLVSGNYLVDFYTLNGKLVHQEKVLGKSNINAPFLSKGIFILQIKNLDSNISFRKKEIKK